MHLPLFLFPSLIYRLNRADGVVKMRNISSYRKAGKSISGCPVANISRNCPDDLHTYNLPRIKDRTATNSIYGNPIYQIRVSPVLTGAGVARKKTQRIFRECRKAKPA